MSGHRCCGTGPDVSGGAGAAGATMAPVRPRSFARRGLGIAGWLVPSAILVVMPKCPVCLAGYIAVATGLGISFSTASDLRTALIVVSTLALLALAVRTSHRFVVRFIHRQPLSNPGEPS